MKKCARIWTSQKGSHAGLGDQIKGLVVPLHSEKLSIRHRYLDVVGLRWGITCVSGFG